MEKANVTPVSQYANWITPSEPESLVTLAEDEVNVEKAAEVQAHIQQFKHDEESGIVEVSENITANAAVNELSAAIGGKGTLKHLDGTTEEITVFPYPQELVQKSMSALKELTNNPEVKKALESEGLTVDFAKVSQTWNDGTGFSDAKAAVTEILDKAGWKSDTPIIRPLTEEEKAATQDAVACACTDCVEDADSDVDTDTMLIVHDLSERLAALEERIALYNTKASHKI